MSTFGTSLDEAFSMEGQLDPQYALEGTQFDVFDASMLKPQKQEPMLENSLQQAQQMQQVKQMQQMQQAQQVQHGQQDDQGHQNPVQNMPVVTNPVTQYPPYEYDAKALQQELQRQNLEKQNQQIHHIKDIKTKRSEHFSGDKTETRKKGDLYKSIIFTLMILLAIATHYFIDYIYVHFVTATGKFSLREELGFRLLYPLIIFLVIWFAKS